MGIAIQQSLNQAKRLEKSGDVVRAVGLYRDVLAQFPRNPKARAGLARLEGSAESLSCMVAKLAAHYKAGDMALVVEIGGPLARRHLACEPLLTVVGAALLSLGRAEDALGCFRAACDAAPGLAETHVNMALCLKLLGQSAEAAEAYLRALDIKPDHVAARNDFAACLEALGDLSGAEAELRHALTFSPETPAIWFNLANTLQKRGDTAGAEAHYAEAIARNPDFSQAHLNLGGLKRIQGNFAAAITAFDRALATDPTSDSAATGRLHSMAHMGDWRWIDDFDQIRDDLGFRGGAGPFPFLVAEDDPHRLLARTRHFVDRTWPQVTQPAPCPPASDRIRIGYFSADFHDHATMHLMARLFELHDQTRFEITAYSYGPPRTDAYRDRLCATGIRIRDIAAMSDPHARALAMTDGLDIAVDLKGHTGDARPGLFAGRMAPIQVSYLGYPGSSAMPEMDYLIADRVVVPPECESAYSEAIVRLPASYQVTDNHRAIGPTPSRAEVGLPEDAMVFCCFNNSYKITPREFDIWMRLLRQVDRSCLWLLASNRWIEPAFRREAAARGIDPDRLVFADRLPAPDHLARHACADLFLDTFHCNAHTTATDALWAGLPVITRPGQQFAARVAASLLTAMGLEELIAPSDEAYEALALALAKDPARRADLRARMGHAKTAAPLFQTETYTRDLERAFVEMTNRYHRGEAPDNIDLPPSLTG